MKAVAGLCAVVPCLALTASAAAAKTINLYGSGSSAAEPEAQALFAAYERLHHNIVFHYNADGGNAGVSDVSNGVSQFAFQPAAPTKTTHPTLWLKMFKDALCIDVNSANKLSELTIPQVRGIFEASPLYTEWGQVPGFEAVSGIKTSSTILEEGRNSAAGQFTFFQQEVLDGGKENSSVSELETDGDVKVAIAENKNAIGYVGLANSSARGEKPLSVAQSSGKTHYACDAKNVRSEKYPLWRYDFAVVPQHPNAYVFAFLEWAADSKTAANAINRAGGVAYLHKL